MKRKISSVSGPSLLKMCQLYATSIRPIIAYACPVWFVVPSIEAKDYGLNQTLIDKLDAIQTGCLRVFAGVFSKTSSLPLHKEVNMEPIAVYLQRMAMSHRACNSMAEDGKLLIGKTTKFPFKSTRSPCFKKQPYFKLYQAASRLAEKAKDQYLSKNLPDVWDNAVDRRIAINEYLEAQSDTLCRYIWWWFKEKRKRRSTRQSWYGTHCHPLATRGDWGASNLKRHQHLTRVESTIILHCRTGFIGLNSYLYKRTVCRTFSFFFALSLFSLCFPACRASKPRCRNLDHCLANRFLLRCSSPTHPCVPVAPTPTPSNTFSSNVPCWPTPDATCPSRSGQ